MGGAAAPALEQVVRAGSATTARRNAAEVLGWIAAPGSTPALVSALGDNDADVRAEAAWALGEISSPAAREALQAAARDDVNPAVRAAAELALSRQPVDTQAVAVAGSEPVSLGAQLADFLAPPRGLILLVSALLAALVLWLRPGIRPMSHRVRHN
jgi:HEAT repeat protein